MPPRASPSPKPRTKAEQRAETLEKILDAAEFLFSKHGLNGVTLRDVAQRVGVHTSLMHYYFVDKRRLFEAVFARRAGITSSRRLDALNQYEREAGDTPPSKGRCMRSWIPTWTCTSAAARAGAISQPSPPR